MLRWHPDYGVNCHHFAPANPTQNGFVESSNGLLGHERLNDNSLTSHAVAPEIIEGRRIDYNATRPHTSSREIPYGICNPIPSGTYGATVK